MKVTSITAQLKNPHRVSISIDGQYRFSLDVAQLAELGLRQGQDITEEAVAAYQQESQFGKLYARTLEYCLMRPHSVREVRDYLFKKTRTTRYKTRRGDIREREGVSPALTERVFDQLATKGYIDDEAFARFWVESRHRTKGASLRKLRSELSGKGVSPAIIDQTLAASDRSDDDELQKILAKKRSKYADDTKLMAYLARQGFSFDDIKRALADEPLD